MDLSVTGAFIYFTIPVFGGIPITQTTVSSFLVAVGLIVLSLVIGRKLKKRPDGWQVLVEKGVGMLYDMVEQTMGKHNLRWAPLIGTVFLMLSIVSFVPGLGLYRCMHHLGEGTTIQGANEGVHAMITIAMIVFGQGAGSFLYRTMLKK